MHPDDDPEDADPGLARERTRLAWTRTAIAFAALGVAILRKDLVTGVIVLAVVPLVWATGRVATRVSRPDQLARRLLTMTVIVVAVSLLAMVLALVGHAPASLDQLLPRHG